MNKPHYTPKEWSIEPCSGKSAILFGRENNGLSNEEVTHTNAIVTVPVHPDCPSINLAQSAAVICYEWYQAQETKLNYEKEVPAPQAELQNFFNQLEIKLDDSNFWRVEEKKEKMLTMLLMI